MFDVIQIIVILFLAIKVYKLDESLKDAHCQLDEVFEDFLLNGEEHE